MYMWNQVHQIIYVIKKYISLKLVKRHDLQTCSFPNIVKSIEHILNNCSAGQWIHHLL